MNNRRREIQPAYLTNESVHWVSSIEEADNFIEQFQTDTNTKFISSWTRDYEHKHGKIWWMNSLKVPYIILKTTVLECQFGKDKNKSKNDKRNKNTNKDLGPKKYKSPEWRSKKVNCPAKLRIQKVIKFDEFKLKYMTKRNREKASLELKKALTDEPQNVIKEHGCLITLPAENSHAGHPVKEIGPHKTFQSEIKHVVEIERSVENEHIDEREQTDENEGVCLAFDVSDSPPVVQRCSNLLGEIQCILHDSPEEVLATTERGLLAILQRLEKCRNVERDILHHPLKRKADVLHTDNNLHNKLKRILPSKIAQQCANEIGIEANVSPKFPKVVPVEQNLRFSTVELIKLKEY